MVVTEVQIQAILLENLQSVGSIMEKAMAGDNKDDFFSCKMGREKHSFSFCLPGREKTMKKITLWKKEKT